MGDRRAARAAVWSIIASGMLSAAVVVLVLLLARDEAPSSSRVLFCSTVSGLAFAAAFGALLMVLDALEPKVGKP